MMFLSFAIFFAFNFSLWFMLPALLLKNIIKPGRKKHDKHIKMDYIVYGALSILYCLSFLIFYSIFKDAIAMSYSSSTTINYFSKGIDKLVFGMLIFMGISIAQGIFSFVLCKKLFGLKEYNKGYVLVSLTGFLNVITYFVSNVVLELNLYSFEAKRYILNMFLKIDYQVLLFLFPILVFGTFALSFIEEE